VIRAVVKSDSDDYLDEVELDKKAWSTDSRPFATNITKYTKNNPRTLQGIGTLVVTLCVGSSISWFRLPAPRASTLERTLVISNY
jgi:hypothetical protein